MISGPLKARLGYLCPVDGLGSAATAPACFTSMYKASDAGHSGPHGMWRCLSFSYRRRRHVPPTRPRRQKTALFWRVLDVHKTSQIPSKMALGRGKGRNPKTAKHHLQMDFLWLFYDFEAAFFNVKIEACAKNIVNTVKKWRPGRVSSSKKAMFSTW